MYLNHKYPDAPLLGLGFSLGANLLTRYLGEEGERSKLKAGAALGCVSVLCMACSTRHCSPFFFFSLCASHGTSNETARGQWHGIELINHLLILLLQPCELDPRKTCVLKGHGWRAHETSQETSGGVNEGSRPRCSKSSPKSFPPTESYTRSIR